MLLPYSAPFKRKKNIGLYLFYIALSVLAAQTFGLLYLLVLMRSRFFKALEFTIDLVLFGNTLTFPFITKQLIAVLFLQAFITIFIKFQFYCTQCIVAEYKKGRIKDYNKSAKNKLKYPELLSAKEIQSGLISSIIVAALSEIVRQIIKEIKFVFNLLTNTSDTFTLFIIAFLGVSCFEFLNKLLKIIEMSFHTLNSFEKDASKSKIEKSLWITIKNKLYETLWVKLRGTLSMTIILSLLSVCLTKALTSLGILKNFSLYVEVGGHILNILNNQNSLLLIIFIEYFIMFVCNEFLQSKNSSNDVRCYEGSAVKTQINKIIHYAGIEIKDGNVSILERLLYIAILTIPFPIGVLMNISIIDNLRFIEIYETIPVLINLGLFIIANGMIVAAFQGMTLIHNYNRMESVIRINAISETKELKDNREINSK